MGAVRSEAVRDEEQGCMTPRKNFSGLVGSQSTPLPTNGVPVHVTLGGIYKIEGHTKDGRRFEKTWNAEIGTPRPRTRDLSKLLSPVLVHDEKRKLDLVYRSRETNAPTGNLRSSIDYAYTPLHEGAPAVAFYADRRRRPSGSKKLQCVIDTISYWKLTTESDEHIYRHQFELPEEEKLLLAMDDASELWFENQGSIVVTERGIEDKPMNKHEIMRANAYRDVEASRMRPFRDNPFTVEGAKRVPLASLFVGLTAVAVIKGFEKLYTSGPQMVKDLTGYKKAAAEAVSGVAIALVGDAWLPKALLPVAAGVGIGGVIAGTMTAIETYKQAAVVAVPTPAAIPAPAAHAPGGQVSNAYYQQPAYGVRR